MVFAGKREARDRLCECAGRPAAENRTDRAWRDPASAHTEGEAGAKERIRYIARLIVCPPGESTLLTQPIQRYRVRYRARLSGPEGRPLPHGEVEIALV